jgi:methionyl aminopeptidase
MAAECIDFLSPLVVEGAIPLEIDRACYVWTLARGAVPAPLNYHGFPNSLCISVNDVVCHGIPSRRPLQSGDIVNIDVTPLFDGYHGDTSVTILVGDVKADVKKLVETTQKAMWDGIAQVRPGNTLGDVGYAIQKRVEPKGYSIVIEYCGHGIGQKFHEDPAVLHTGKPKKGLRLEAGMIFTIEPMINLGRREITIDRDGWTVRTQDGSLSAQFEHTVLVTPTGVEVLTLRGEERETALKNGVDLGPT